MRPLVFFLLFCGFAFPAALRAEAADATEAAAAADACRLLSESEIEATLSLAPAGLAASKPGDDEHASVCQGKLGNGKMMLRLSPLTAEPDPLAPWRAKSATVRVNTMGAFRCGTAAMPQAMAAAPGMSFCRLQQGNQSLLLVVEMPDATTIVPIPKLQELLTLAAAHLQSGK
ncbi:MAG: hypothetical protein K6U10_05010 [Acidobacteriia bacterium]|nr:hypothetical protein [Methyloceanibacter sp.]MBX5471900.1 hypothetical protein [Acetobacteraceae bacterium]MCL6491166.1 hypothetical protein [Terriglobia bacterium]